ncbi:MAG TPA: histidine kinase [Candidatus Limnocylindrales bacterium]
MSRAVAAILALLATAFGLLVEHLAHNWEFQPAWIPILDLGVGWVLVASGLVGAIARPSQPAGRRLILAGFLWFVGTPRQHEYLVIDDLAFAFQGYFDLVLVLIALSFPARWPARREERTVLVALGVVFGIRSVVRLVARGPDFGVHLLGDDLAYAFVAWVDVALASLFFIAGCLLLRRAVVSKQPMRRLIVPVAAAGVAASFAETYRFYYPLSQLGLVPPLSDDIGIPLSWMLNILRILVPLGILVGILRLRPDRSTITQAIADVGDAPTSLILRDALAGALRDPSLRILTWDEDAAAYRDETGAVVPTPVSTSQATVTPVDTGGRRLAALVHDPALDEDPSLVAAGVAVTRLALDNERLNLEISRQLVEVRASRARIVQAGDAERHRIERDLHDGVQQRLVALAMALRRAGAASEGESEAGRALDRGADEALVVVEDVRELARGIHPAVLTEAGLRPALQALADRSPIPVELEVDLGAEVTGTAAATAYFVASEALANIAKHADATTIRLTATTAGGRMALAIEDDGVGGADPTGSGLRGLADRVAASGGTFSVKAGPDGGTRLSAVVPLD